MITRFETFIQDLSKIDLYWHRLASVEMAEYGLKGTWAVYFTQLYHNPDGLTNAQLQDLCGKDKSDVSKDLKSLEEMGFVIKNGSERKYKQLIVLTDKGRELTEKIVEKIEHIMEAIGQEFSENERENFYNMFQKIADRLKVITENGIDHKN